MIKDNDRFFSPTGMVSPGGPSSWQIVDWDQRRLVSVTMDEEQESEHVAIEYLRKYVDDLPPSVYEIHISADGELISMSSNPDDDQTQWVYHPPIDEIERPKDIRAISRSQLQELDRLGPMVDLVVCPKSTVPERKLIFKYYFIPQRLLFTGREMNIWMRLPSHPHIVPFDKIVVDEIENRVVGFTTLFITGGTLEENRCRTFKLKWLYQLISAIDELNLNLGIAHQDVALRNLLVDEDADSLLLFDFNFAARIGEPRYSESRNDINGVIFTMYELITRDDAARAIPHDSQNIFTIEEREWTKHPDVQLDHPVSTFREVLSEWSQKRRTAKQLVKHTDAPQYVDWPDLPEPPTLELMVDKGNGFQPETRVSYEWPRADLLRSGKSVLNWQRVPQRKLKAGERVMATGELVRDLDLDGAGL